jgi:hypothetical protein
VIPEHLLENVDSTLDIDDLTSGGRNGNGLHILREQPWASSRFSSSGRILEMIRFVQSRNINLHGILIIRHGYMVTEA